MAPACVIAYRSTVGSPGAARNRAKDPPGLARTHRDVARQRAFANITRPVAQIQVVSRPCDHASPIGMGRLRSAAIEARALRAIKKPPPETGSGFDVRSSCRGIRPWQAWQRPTLPSLET